MDHTGCFGTGIALMDRPCTDLLHTCGELGLSFQVVLGPYRRAFSKCFHRVDKEQTCTPFPYG